jgi:hypothetical protein
LTVGYADHFQRLPPSPEQIEHRGQEDRKAAIDKAVREADSDEKINAVARRISL